MDEEPKNDIALVQTFKKIQNFRRFAIPLCTQRTAPNQLLRTYLGTCGMGSITKNRSDITFPEFLRVRKLNGGSSIR